MSLLATTVYAQGAFAQIQKNPAVSTLITNIISAMVSPLVKGLFVLTFLIFIWGVVEMIMHAGDSTAREKGQNHVLWGIVGIAIMISVYGIIRLIANTVGVADPFA